MQRLGLRTGEGLNECCKALETRFRAPPTQSLKDLENLKYSLADVYQRRDPIDYIQKIVIHGLNSGLATTEALQAKLAYNHMDVRLRMTLTEPHDRTTLSVFVDQVNQRKTDWYDRYQPSSNNYRRASYGRDREQRGDRGYRDSWRRYDSLRNVTGRTDDRDKRDNRDRRGQTALRYRDYGRRDGRGTKRDDFRQRDRYKARDSNYRKDQRQPQAAYNADPEDDDDIPDDETFSSDDDEAYHARADENDDGSDGETGVEEVSANNVEVIQSTARPATGTGRDYRLWNYVKFPLRFKLDQPPVEICFDTGCGMTLIDRKFLDECDLKPDIKTLPEPIMVKGVGSKRQPSSQYLVLNIYVNGQLLGRPATAHLQREVHIVDNLGPKMLMGVDIIGPEKMTLDAAASTVTMGCHNGMVVPVRMDPPEATWKKFRVKTAKRVVIPAHTVTAVPVAHPKLEDRATYFFVPEYSQTTRAVEKAGGIYNHVVDANFSSVHVRNDSAEDLVIPRHASLGFAQRYDESEVYMAKIDPAAHELAAYSGRAISAFAPKASLDPKYLRKSADGITVFARDEGAF